MKTFVTNLGSLVFGLNNVRARANHNTHPINSLCSLMRSKMVGAEEDDFFDDLIPRPPPFA